ncbi:hypothetical protein TSUD_117580 [Trifolium subterraneum]|nr:hypothetical protein TSUD_117580 [Trifolium subterraneum]
MFWRGVLSSGTATKRSLWWRDMEGLGVVCGVEGDWTQYIFVKKLGSRGTTRFLLERWVGNNNNIPLSLCDVFLRLFKISL